MADLLFDTQQYQAPEPKITEDGSDQYEDPAYITPGRHTDEYRRHYMIEFLGSSPENEKSPAHFIAEALGFGLGDVIAVSHKNREIFNMERDGIYRIISLTHLGRELFEAIRALIPASTSLFSWEKVGDKIKLTWRYAGGLVSGIYKPVTPKRDHGDGWAVLEERLSQGKYQQWWLHYQFPKQTKRSKYVPRHNYHKVRDFVEAKKPVAEILAVLKKQK